MRLLAEAGFHSAAHYTCHRLENRTYGAWVLTAFRYLARMKRLGGSRLDPFGYTEERRAGRRLIEAYERVVDGLLARLSLDNHAPAVEIASVPEHIRGFGHVKERHLAATTQREADLIAAYRQDQTALSAAA